MAKIRRSAKTSSAIRQIERQIKRMSDADVYALSLSADRVTRRIASQDAHKRAEAYAMGESE